jgi:alternate signal-mediated exported protein
MNKLIRGAITGAAGIALLLGGAGTFAAWNDAATAAPDTHISTGNLKIDSATADGWFSDENATAGIDATTFHAVPGDTVYYKATMKLTATGDHLAAEVNVDPTSIAKFGKTTDKDTLNTTLQSVSGTGIAVNPNPKTGGYSITQKGDITATVIVKVEFPFDSSTNDSQDDTITLPELKLLLTQIEA